MLLLDGNMCKPSMSSLRLSVPALGTIGIKTVVNGPTVAYFAPIINSAGRPTVVDFTALTDGGRSTAPM